MHFSMKRRMKTKFYYLVKCFEVFKMMNLHFTFDNNKLHFYNKFRRSEIHAVIY